MRKLLPGQVLYNLKACHQHRPLQSTTVSAHTNKYKCGLVSPITCLRTSGAGKLSTDKCCLSSQILHQLHKNYWKLSDVIVKVVVIPCVVPVKRMGWTAPLHVVNVEVCAA